MLGVWAFAVLFHVPRKYYLACSMNGAVGWFCYLELTRLGIGDAAAVIYSSVILTLLSRSFAVALKAPATNFLLTGIFPLVPGAGIYYTAYYFMQQDLRMGGMKAIEVLSYAGGIALGILIGFMIPQHFFTHLVKDRI